MNILDTFVLMFECDTTKVQKGAAAGEAAAKSLKDAVDKADQSADKLGSNFLKMAKFATEALASVIALGALKTVVNDTAAHTAALGLQARAMGVNVETMTAYQQAVVSMGGDAGAAASSLSGLRDKFVEMSRFGTMVGPDAFMFRQLGLSAKEMHDSIKDPTIALGALADKFKGLDQTQQLYIGKKLGLDLGTIQLLSQGKDAFDALIARQKELGAVTQKQADVAIKYKIAQQELGMTFETVKREITTQMLPALTWIIDGIDNVIRWMREHKGFAVGFFGTLATVISVALLPALVESAIAMWAFIAPLLLAAAPFIALGVAIGLVIDDIQSFRAGGNSMIGEILNKWPIIGQIARSVSQIVKMSFDLIKDSISWAAKSLMNEGVQAWDKYKGALQPVIDIFNVFVGLLEKAWGWVTKFEDAPKNVLNWIGSRLAGLTGDKYTPVGGPDEPRPTPAAVAKLGDTTNGREIASMLVASGKWTPEQAAGIAGSFMQESGGNAGAVNKSSGAYGLGQWLGDRVGDFKAFSGKDLKGSSLQDQIDFFNYETTHKEKRAGDMLRSAQSASEAADIHSKYYERPGASEANNARREAYANMIYSGRTQLASANVPLAAQSSASITNSVGGNRSSQFTMGNVAVHTQASSPDGIGNAVQQAIRDHFNSGLDYHDDGVIA